MPAEYVTVTIDSILFLSNTSELTDITNTWESEDCTTQYQEDGTDNTYPSECKFGQSSSEAMCRNAVKSITYTVKHRNNAASDILNVSASIIVTDIVFEEEASVTQSFGITFESNPVAAGISKDHGNIVERCATV